MAEASFDDLLRSLQAALDEAGARVGAASDARREAHGRSLTFMLPRPGGGPDAFEALELPLDSLRSPARLRIAALSLDFDCRLGRAGVFGARRRTVVRIGAGGGAPGQGRRMRIMLDGVDGADCVRGEVRLDGLLLQSLPVPKAGERRRPGRVRSAVAWLLARLLPERPVDGFVLSEEQARRVEHLFA